MLRYISCCAECYYAECHYAECLYAECYYAVSVAIYSLYAHCRYTKFYYAKCHFAEWHHDECCVTLGGATLLNSRRFIELSKHLCTSAQCQVDGMLQRQHFLHKKDIKQTSVFDMTEIFLAVFYHQKQTNLKKLFSL